MSTGADPSLADSKKEKHVQHGSLKYELTEVTLSDRASRTGVIMRTGATKRRASKFDNERIGDDAERISEG
ncbi:hypothetical protein EYF80_034307 [Liparis tanakae]|uniref:Uncharacterized protein n=1 Tax=Liparis tanakae TaxID=230148 RepID=A0A4Z2GQW2_9TELE|nr:hypothetical protein EYF80_034307 [Liparis tanakae]